jgi:hypothetical protein
MSKGSRLLRVSEEDLSPCKKDSKIWPPAKLAAPCALDYVAKGVNPGPAETCW